MVAVDCRSAMRSLLITLLLVVSTSGALGQVRTLRWTDGMCAYSGTYNSAKISEARLKNTLKLIDPGSFGVETEATAWQFADIEKLSPAALEREYAAKSAELKGLDIIKTPYFEKFRRDKLKELEQVYKLSKSTIQAYRNPAHLIEYEEAKACDKPYVDPLINGGNELLTAWRKVNEDSRSKNADPERLRRIFDQQYNSPDRMKYAQVEVMMFGWWNCANALIPRIDYDETPLNELKKVFIRVRTRCEEA